MVAGQMAMGNLGGRRVRRVSECSGNGRGLPESGGAVISDIISILYPSSGDAASGTLPPAVIEPVVPADEENFFTKKIMGIQTWILIAGIILIFLFMRKK